MRRINSKLVMYVGALLLVASTIPGALAQCGLATKAVKPTGWNPQIGRAQLLPAQVQGIENRNEGDRNAPGLSIVGMWHVIFTAETGPVTGVIDNSVVVWHSDGTEIMNSSRAAQDGNFCMGVWVQTGERSYSLNHIPWQGNDTTNSPGGIGNAQDGAQLTEQVTLSQDGNSYSGSFKLVAYNSSGEPVATFTGTLKAKRITVDTPFSDLL
jgi:hypothetical protein